MATPEHPSDPPLRVAWLREGSFTYTDESRSESRDESRERPVLVALHGLPGSVRDYRWLAPALEGVRVLRVEQPGFGGTPLSTGPDPSLAGRTQFVLDALDSLGVDRFAVLGHSMGGPLAAAVAAAAPERARGLVLLASVGLRPHRLLRKLGRYPDPSTEHRSAVGHDPEAGRLRRRVGSDRAERGVLPTVLPRVLDLPLLGALLVKGPIRQGFVRAGFPASTSDASIRQCMRILSGLRFPEIRAAFGAVRCSTALAWAEDDPLVEGAIGLELASLLPAGPRLAFETGGHNVQKSHAVEIGAALSAWMRSLPA